MEGLFRRGDETVLNTNEEKTDFTSLKLPCDSGFSTGATAMSFRSAAMSTRCRVAR